MKVSLLTILDLLPPRHPLLLAIFLLIRILSLLLPLSLFSPPGLQLDSD